MTDYEYTNPYMLPKKSYETPDVIQDKLIEDKLSELQRSVDSFKNIQNLHTDNSESADINNQQNDGNSFTYFIKSPLSTKFLYFVDILVSSLIFFVLLALLVSPISYIFNKPLTNYPQGSNDAKDKVSESKFIVFLEIIIELSLIVSAVCIVYIITERINIFRIKNINHNEARKIFFHIMTGLSIISVHRILQDKIEYIFSDNKTNGLLG